MTYVTDQTSEELRQHMKRLTNMPGWREPLSDRLWKEIQEQDKIKSDLLEALEDMCGVWRTVCDVNGHDPDHMCQYTKAMEILAKIKGE